MNRPSQAICSSSVLWRSLPRARSAGRAGLRSGDQRLDHRPPEPARQLGATEAGLDPGVLQHLGEPLALAGPLVDKPLRDRVRTRSAATSAAGMKLAAATRIRAAQRSTGSPRHPLAARDVPHMRRIAHAHLDRSLGQREAARPPAHPGLSIAAPVTPSPDSQAAILASDRQNVLKLLVTTMRSPGPAPGTRTATQTTFLRRRSRRPADGRYPSPASLPSPILDTGEPPAEPQQDQDPVTRARSGNPGYLQGRLRRQSENRHAAPRSNDVSGRRSPSFMHPRASRQ